MHETNVTLREFPAQASSDLAHYALVANALSRIPVLLLAWQRRASQRAHLRDLDPHFLEDVGMSPTDRDREAQKPFWKR